MKALLDYSQKQTDKRLHNKQTIKHKYEDQIHPNPDTRGHHSGCHLPAETGSDRRLVRPALRGALLGKEIGTSKSILPVVGGRFERPPHIVLSGAFLAEGASDRNSWPRRWASGQRRDWDPGRTCERQKQKMESRKQIATGEAQGKGRPKGGNFPTELSGYTGIPPGKGWPPPEASFASSPVMAARSVNSQC